MVMHMRRFVFVLASCTQLGTKATSAPLEFGLYFENDCPAKFGTLNGGTEQPSYQFNMPDAAIADGDCVRGEGGVVTDGKLSFGVKFTCGSDGVVDIEFCENADGGIKTTKTEVIKALAGGCANGQFSGSLGSGEPFEYPVSTKLMAGSPSSVLPCGITPDDISSLGTSDDTASDTGIGAWSCEEIGEAYGMQGCCGNPGKPFEMPKGRRLQGTTGAGPVYCQDVKNSYRLMKCCSKTSEGGGDTGTMMNVDFTTDSSGCLINFGDYGLSCLVPGLGQTCCGYYVGLMKQGVTQEAEYARLLDAATKDGTCAAAEMIGMGDEDFLKCVSGLPEAQDAIPDSQPGGPSEDEVKAIFDRADKDQTGTMSMAEYRDAMAISQGMDSFDAWVAQFPTETQEAMAGQAKEAFDGADMNGDGVLTWEEVSVLFSASQ